MIVREDLPTGLQMAQVAHACTEFALNHPEKASSTPVGVVLGVPGEAELLAWEHVAALDGPYVLFREEDLGGETTAIAVVSDGEKFRSLPLAGRTPSMAS